MIISQNNTVIDTLPKRLPSIDGMIRRIPSEEKRDYITCHLIVDQIERGNNTFLGITRELNWLYNIPYSYVQRYLISFAMVYPDQMLWEYIGLDVGQSVLTQANIDLLSSAKIRYTIFKSELSDVNRQAINVMQASLEPAIIAEEAILRPEYVKLISNNIAKRNASIERVRASLVKLAVSITLEEENASDMYSRRGLSIRKEQLTQEASQCFDDVLATYCTLDTSKGTIKAVSRFPM